MRNKTFTIIVLVNLVAMILLAIFFPHLMISPGKLIDVHAELDKDCFACHTPFIGSTSEKCTVCHEVEEIGKITTNGLLIATENKNVAFHQKLIEENCMSCHSDHKGVKAFRPISQFSHNLLDPALQTQCNACHRSPGDAMHLKIKGNCDWCHTLENWIPAIFEHEEYFRSVDNKECTGCHQKPDDRLHRQLKDKCDTCHRLDRWKPAIFDHDKYFRFDKDHQTECVTCHVNNDYTHYTCYGCHEHSRSEIRKEHVKEGIKGYENCAQCHRSGDEDEAKYLWRSLNDGSSSINQHKSYHDRHKEKDDD